MHVRTRFNACLHCSQPTSRHCSQRTLYRAGCAPFHCMCSNCSNACMITSTHCVLFQMHVCNCSAALFTVQDDTHRGRGGGSRTGRGGQLFGAVRGLLTKTLRRKSSRRSEACEGRRCSAACSGEPALMRTRGRSVSEGALNSHAIQA
jgi:hypothetical protein